MDDKNWLFSVKTISWFHEFFLDVSIVVIMTKITHSRVRIHQISVSIGKYCSNDLKRDKNFKIWPKFTIFKWALHQIKMQKCSRQKLFPSTKVFEQQNIQRTQYFHTKSTYFFVKYKLIQFANYYEGKVVTKIH